MEEWDYEAATSPNRFAGLGNERVTLKQHARDETTRHDTGASMWHVRLFLVHAGRWGGRGEGANPPKKERKINKRRVKREESDTNTR